MTDVRQRWSARLRGRAGDTLLAAVAVVASLALIPSVSPRGPLALCIVVNILSAATLAWRRVAPLPVLVIAIGAVAAQALIAGSVSNSVAQFVVLLIQLFSFGAYASGRDAPVGLAFGIAGVYVAQFHDPTSTGTDRVVAPLALTLLPFAAGRLLRRQRRTAAHLRRLTVELESRREMDAQAATLAERARIAREVHDVVAHSVGVMLVQSAAAESLVERDPRAAETALAAVREVGHEALGELRRLLQLLGDETAGADSPPQPGLAQLDRLVAQARASGLDVELQVDGAACAESVPPGVDLAAYRLVQESLTNVRKHAHATVARVSVHHGAETIRIAVVDDGRGSTSPADATTPRSVGHDGRGLLGMRERIALYQGTFSAGPDETGGWRVCATLPRIEP